MHFLSALHLGTRMLHGYVQRTVAVPVAPINAAQMSTEPSTVLDTNKQSSVTCAQLLTTAH